jgi:hypothetical protein
MGVYPSCRDSGESSPHPPTPTYGLAPTFTRAVFPLQNVVLFTFQAGGIETTGVYPSFRDSG